MDALTAVATPHGLKLLNSTLKNSATRYTLIGATSHDAPSPGVFYTAAIETSYYDSNGVLTFVVELPAAQDFNRYLHGIAIIDASDQVVINTPTPKIALASGIGGMVTIKAAVTGEPGEVVFKASDYVTAPELRDNWLIPATSSKRGLIRIATAAEITTGSATDVAVNPKSLKRQVGTKLIPATTSKRGLIRIATDEEITTGSATDVAVNPSQLHANKGDLLRVVTQAQTTANSGVAKADAAQVAVDRVTTKLLPATTSKRGLIRIATDEETTTGSATDVAVSPRGLLLFRDTLPLPGPHVVDIFRDGSCIEFFPLDTLYSLVGERRIRLNISKSHVTDYRQDDLRLDMDGRVALFHRHESMSTANGRGGGIVFDTGIANMRSFSFLWSAKDSIDKKHGGLIYTGVFSSPTGCLSNWSHFNLDSNQYLPFYDHYWLVVFQANAFNIYNQITLSSVLTGNLNTATNSFYGFGHNNHCNFRGYFKNYRVFNRRLTNSDIAVLAQEL